MLRRYIIDQWFLTLFIVKASKYKILSYSKWINLYLVEAEKMLKLFVSQACNLYDNYFVTYNVHSLIHVCDDVHKYGPLDRYSCFAFELFVYYKTIPSF